jgi:cell division protease FtsH
MFMSVSSKMQAVRKEVTPTEFKEYLANDNLSELLFNKSVVSGKVKDPKALVPEVYTMPVTFQEFEEIRKLAVEKKVKYRTVPDTSWMASVFWTLLQMLLWVGLFMWLMGAQLRRAGEFGQSRAKMFVGRDRKTFTDVAGCDEVKEELQDVVGFLKNPRKFSRLGGRIPKGVLLYGPPGTGKTLLAQAAAGEAGVPFFHTSGSAFIEMFVGVGASRVRNLFEAAKRAAPCVVFIDEIDAIGGKRGAFLGHGEHNQTIDELLGYMDGFEKNHGVVVVAATNRLDSLDEALIRPGRFDRHIEVAPPDEKGREAILKIHARSVLLDSNINLRDVAKDTGGMVGADLANVINEAALIAAKRNKAAVEQDDLNEAVDKIGMGPARTSMELPPKQQKLIAYHEAGHTLIARLLKEKGAYPVHKVTIIPRGRALGFTKYLPEDIRLYTKAQLEAMIMSAAGGRAAEDVVYGEVTSGGCNDFEKATAILQKMVCEFGMSEAGLVVYKEGMDPWGRSTGLNASDKTKEKVDEVIKKRMDELYQKVKDLLKANRRKLDALVVGLLEKKTLTSVEIDEIINSA